MDGISHQINDLKMCGFKENRFYNDLMSLLQCGRIRNNYFEKYFKNAILLEKSLKFERKHDQPKRSIKENTMDS